MGQASFVAAIPEPIAKARCREGSTEFRQQEGHVVAWPVANCRRKLGVEWDFENLSRLVLHNVQQVTGNVLPAHTDHVTTALARVEQK